MDDFEWTLIEDGHAALGGLVIRTPRHVNWLLPVARTPWTITIRTTSDGYTTLSLVPTSKVRATST